MVLRRRSGVKPSAAVALAWGSRSMSRVRQPAWARQAARLTAVVVLPTPPFWLTMAIILAGCMKFYCNRTPLKRLLDVNPHRAMVGTHDVRLDPGVLHPGPQAG